VAISGDVVVKTSPVPVSHGKLQDTTVAWATVPYEGKQAMLGASEDKTGTAKASFDMGDRSVELRKGPPAD
jgi:hypothetical protein